MNVTEQNGGQPACWAVVPAAGAGRRVGAERPKQYLPLAGRSVIEHTLSRLATHPAVCGIVVALAAEDPYWPALRLELPVPVETVRGGVERCHSVLAALDHLADRVAGGQWVLVHDAARPCLRGRDISALIEQVRDEPDGGLLGLPLTDTIKRADSTDHVVGSVDRSGLWRALTPQMFRLEPLRAALRGALDDSVLVTDEAAAMERTGARPRMVEGAPDNIKITHPQDLAVAERFLKRQESM